VSDNIQTFETHPFIQALFEDLVLSLPNVGCRFQGGLDYIYITVNADPIKLKNQLFLLFYNLAQTEKILDFQFTISHIENSVKWFFRSQRPIHVLKEPEKLQYWNSEYSLLEDDGGFWLELEAGPISANHDLPFDHDKALELYPNEEMVQEVLRKFITRCQVLITSLTQAIQAQDLPEVFRLSHTIKGSARNVFALKISTQALRLEKTSRSGSLVGAEEMVSDIAESYKEFIQYLGVTDD